MEQYNILIFPCGTEIANEIISSLVNNKYFKMYFASSEKISYCNYRNYDIDYIPYVTEDTFENVLNTIINNKDIDFIIPAHDDVAIVLSNIEHKIDAKIIGQNQKVNDIVRFKDKTYEFFKETLPVPITYSDNLLKEHNFPIYLKPNNGYGARNNFLIKNLEEYKITKNKIDINEYVISEYLTGDEFTIDCFSDNGKVLYSGARTREKMTRGISIQSTYVSNEVLQKEFNNYAKIISKELMLHGLWFFQMKYNKKGKLKLLEIGPRVSGTMMLNRARGINFVELALFQKLGFEVEVIENKIDISLGRALIPKYKSSIKYENLYIDFDDTLLLDERYINTDLMKLIFQAKNEEKKIYLITKNKKNNLARILHKFRLTNIFDDIIHLNIDDNKIDYMKNNSLLIDDSFQERKEAIENGIYAYGNDCIEVLLK